MWTGLQHSSELCVVKCHCVHNRIETKVKILINLQTFCDDDTHVNLDTLCYSVFSKMKQINRLNEISSTLSSSTISKSN